MLRNMLCGGHQARVYCSTGVVVWDGQQQRISHPTCRPSSPLHPRSSSNAVGCKAYTAARLSLLSCPAPLLAPLLPFTPAAYPTLRPLRQQGAAAVQRALPASSHAAQRHAAGPLWPNARRPGHADAWRLGAVVGAAAARVSVGVCGEV